MCVVAKSTCHKFSSIGQSGLRSHRGELVFCIAKYLQEVTFQLMAEEVLDTNTGFCSMSATVLIMGSLRQGITRYDADQQLGVKKTTGLWILLPRPANCWDHKHESSHYTLLNLPIFQQKAGKWMLVYELLNYFWKLLYSFPVFCFWETKAPEPRCWHAGLLLKLLGSFPNFHSFQSLSHGSAPRPACCYLSSSCSLLPRCLFTTLTHSSHTKGYLASPVWPSIAQDPKLNHTYTVNVK